MKKLLLIAAILAMMPVAFAEPDLGAPERGPISGTPNPPGGGTPDNGGGDGGDNSGGTSPINNGSGYTCRMTSGRYDATCVDNTTGHTMRFDHESVVTYNSACRKIRSGTYHCNANFLDFTDDVEPGDIL